MRVPETPDLFDFSACGFDDSSTAATRAPKTGAKAIAAAIEALSKRHEDHIRHYGDGLEARLTGLQQTCSITEFRSGIAHRGASIRIPQSVAQSGDGYFDDRRPGANADPYRVC